MTAWFDLTKKEFHLGLPAFIFSLIALIGIFTISIMFGLSTNLMWEMLTIGAFVAVALHVFYLAYYLLYSLSVERKRMHLWLHNPLPIESILLAKLISGLVYMLITLITAVIVLWQAYRNSTLTINLNEWLTTAISSVIALLLTALLLGCTYLFFWTIFMVLSKTYNDFFSFVLAFFLFLAAASLLNIIGDLSFLTDWGVINSDSVLSGFELNISNENYHYEIEHLSTIFYIGHFVRDLVLAVLLFAGSSWILDRKVEV
ncbi:hypothetical protein [Oceanobacillus sp. AG]|uniref:hypothetical protein n=1 Tax=Oceanobacillus sp. AG TaxID=2681969 RepID=UPI0012EBE13F|nr:hypothetical protein [Oceanobacillus sp. AG]